MKRLTRKQADIFWFIKNHIRSEGMSPTAKEIGAEFNMFPSGAWAHVEALIRKEAVSVKRGTSRSLVPVKGYRVKVKA